jgi:hypothetical protein
MEPHLKRIYRMNLITIGLFLVYGTYLLRNVIFALYREIESKILAGIFIPIVGIMIITLFLSSNRSMRRDLYDRNKQKWAAILFVCFVFSSDVLIFYAFMTFHPLGKLFFALNNLLALWHFRRFLVSFSDKRRMIF